MASSLGTPTALNANVGSSAPKPLSIERKNCVTQEGSRNHTRTHSLPGDMRKIFRKPPEYTETAVVKTTTQPASNRESCEVNLNDIFEIISKQEQPAQFEVTRNPDTGVVTLKEATTKTPKTSHIVTSDIKAPVLIEDLDLPVDLEQGGLVKIQQQSPPAQEHVEAKTAEGLPNGTVLNGDSKTKIRDLNRLSNGQNHLTEMKTSSIVDGMTQNSQSFKGMTGSQLIWIILQINLFAITIDIYTN